MEKEQRVHTATSVPVDKYKLQAWLYIVFWIMISCTMILFNKAVLDQMQFPYPMFLTTWHMFFSTVMTQIMAKTTNMLPGVREGKVDSAAMKAQILPVSVCFAISLVLANKAYIYLSVSYIQVRHVCRVCLILQRACVMCCIFAVCRPPRLMPVLANNA